MTSVASSQLFFSKHCLLLSHRITSNAKCWAILLGRGTSPACETGLDSAFDLLSKFPNRERSSELAWHWESQLPSRCAAFLSSTRTESFPLSASSLSRWVSLWGADAEQLLFSSWLLGRVAQYSWETTNMQKLGVCGFWIKLLSSLSVWTIWLSDLLCSLCLNFLFTLNSGMEMSFITHNEAGISVVTFQYFSIKNSYQWHWSSTMK